MIIQLFKVNCHIPFRSMRLAIGVEWIGDFCNLNPVQYFHCVIQTDPNPAVLSKYLIQSGLYQR